MREKYTSKESSSQENGDHFTGLCQYLSGVIDMLERTVGEDHSQSITNSVNSKVR